MKQCSESNHISIYSNYYADIIFYNIPISYYVEQLSKVLIADIAFREYIPLNNNIQNPIFYIKY